MLALVSCLAPVSGAAQPRPQDVALLEGLLQSQVVRELSWALQHLMPHHSNKDSYLMAGKGEGCSCCRLEGAG